MAVGEGTAETSARPARAARLPKVRHILERIDAALHDIASEVRIYAQEHPEFAAIGQRMLQEWEAGAATSLRG